MTCMKRIFWINGAYGVGKSTVAECLQNKLDKAHIFDAEEVGNAIRDNYPNESKHSMIFEDYPLWIETNYKLLLDIFNKYNGDIIVPMTLIREQSYFGIIKMLEDSGISVKYIFLDGDYQTIHDRIIARGEKEDCWCMQNINSCLDIQNNEKHAIHINTVGKTIDDIVERIID